MRSGRTIFLEIAFALSGAAAFLSLHAADSKAPAAPAPAPEKIEFSRTTSTTPKVPRPGAKNEERLKDFGNVQETPSAGAEFIMPMAPPTMLPSKAAAEKLLREWDRKKNWAFEEPEDPLARTDETGDDLTRAEKPKTAMEKYLTGDDSTRNTAGPTRLRDLDRDNDRRDNRPDLDSNDRNGRRDDNDPNSRDPNDNSESNGLAEFNLKNFIRQQNGMPTFLKDNQLPKASQLFRSEIGGASGAFQQQADRERAQREARSAEFMQMLKPRSSLGFAGANDPVNAPDLSRRAVNPITPRTIESSGAGSPFSSPTPSPASRIQENSMLGVTGPAASSIAPTVSAPLPRPEPARSRQVIIEAPRRIGF